MLTECNSSQGEEGTLCWKYKNGSFMFLSATPLQQLESLSYWLVGCFVKR